MRLPFFICIIASALIPSTSFARDNSNYLEKESRTWNRYPQSLQQFDYSGDLLEKKWHLLAAGIQLPWPDATFVQDMILQFPQLSNQLFELARQPNSHPSLPPILKQNYQPLAETVQQVWRLHYQGQFQQAYELGMKLGPAGLLPALYAKLIHTTFLVPHDNKEKRLLEVDAIMQPLSLKLTDFEFLTFGNAYQKARRLELMSTATATASGLLGPTQQSLRDLLEKRPQHPLYSAMLAGIDAGIIERVGGFLGNMTYGADEDQVIKLFDSALSQEKRLAVLYNEYSQALIRLNDSDYHPKLSQLLQTCIDLPVYSAEEALNQQVCRNHQATFSTKMSNRDAH